jgi:serine/threonine-protein kinase RsbW
MALNLVVRGRLDHLPQIAEFIEQAGLQAGLDETAIFHCQLSVDEHFTNVVQYGYGGEDHGDVQLACEPAEGELTITITDQSPQFDPTSVPPPNFNVALEDMRVGGLGIYFIRQKMDAVEYAYANGNNTLVLVKRREALEK